MIPSILVNNSERPYVSQLVQNTERKAKKTYASLSKYGLYEQKLKTPTIRQNLAEFGKNILNSLTRKIS
jgi:hypothetical protein